MGKLRNIEIYFDENKNIFFPGDLINGYIILESKGEIKINALKVYIRGVARVHWTETKTGGYRLGNYTEHYRSEIEYICLKQTLIGSGRDCENSSILRELTFNGREVFPFSFTLPRNGLVTSFEGKHGSIRYYLKAELDKPWTLNHKVKKLFTVITPVDINDSEYLSEVENEASKTICCWCCTSGPIKMQAKTDRRGYCPGENIQLNACFENFGNRNVIPQASLYQIQTFNANGKRIIATNKLNVIAGSQINSGTIDEWNSKLLKIPAVSPSINSALIRVEYFVKVSLLIPGSYTLSCVLPIVIGTVPFRPSFNTAVICRMVPVELPERQREILDAPPAYSEIASMSDDVENILDDNYCPLYTYVTGYGEPPSYGEVQNSTCSTASITNS